MKEYGTSTSGWHAAVSEGVQRAAAERRANGTAGRITEPVPPEVALRNVLGRNISAALPRPSLRET
jgi:hypothetical protein